MNSALAKTTGYTLLALLAFAGNSVLCRLAIGSGEIDPASFTLIRLVSGAMVLLLLVRISRGRTLNPGRSGSWLAALMLLVYAATFSFAYTLLDTGVGALVLFGVVQITTVLHGLMRGEHLGGLKLLGLLGAFSGLVYLLMPVSAETAVTVSSMGFLLMALSGAAWGAYTLLGKGSVSPLADTADNFFRASLLSLLLLLPLWLASPQLSYAGIALSIASGAITSGLGYTIWYSVVPKLSSIQSGVVQLSVPLLAAVGGVVFVDELFTRKLLISMLVTLLGILIVIAAPKISKAK